MMKKIILSVMLVMSAASWAELPSWGMTESQYNLPNFSNKMSEIGSQAAKNNWMLKITAPSDWHGIIKNGLTKTGQREVQVTFKDSLYKSISISAVPGAKTAKITPSTSNGATIQKQVVIDKPEIDTTIEAPDFGDTDFKNNTAELLDNISAIEITVPNSQVSTGRAKVDVTEQPKVKPEPKAVAQVEVKAAPAPEKPAVPAAVKTQTEPVAVSNVVQKSEQIENNKETLRKRHARTKRVEKLLSYNNIRSKDELFIKGSVVLIKRFINQGVALYYWMKEPYDPEIHKLVEKGSGKFQKNDEAAKGESPKEEQLVKEAQSVESTNLDFVAVDTAVEDNDELRSEHIRNKRVDYTISAKRLKKGDVLYVKNQTVLVVRPVTRSQSTYYWLVGETTIDKEVERKGDSMFVIK